MKKTNIIQAGDESPTGKSSLFKQAKQKFSKIRKGILKQLAKSKESGSLIAVNSPGLGEGTIVTAVEDIYSSGAEEIVVLKWYDINGHLPSRTHVSLDEILEVCPVTKGSRKFSF